MPDWQNSSQHSTPGSSSHPNVWLTVAAGDRESYPPPLYLFLRAETTVWRRHESRPHFDPSNTEHGIRTPTLLRRVETPAPSGHTGQPPSCDETAHLFGAIADIEAFVAAAESAGALLDPTAECPPASPMLAGMPLNSAPLARWIGQVYATLMRHRPTLILRPTATPDGVELYVLDLDPWEASLLTIRLLLGESAPPSSAAADLSAAEAELRGSVNVAVNEMPAGRAGIPIPNAEAIAVTSRRRREASARLDEIEANREAALRKAQALLAACEDALPRTADFDNDPVIPPDRRPAVAEALLALWAGLRAARIDVALLINHVENEARLVGGDAFSYIVHLSWRGRDGDREGTLGLIADLNKLPGRRDPKMPGEASQEAVWSGFIGQLRARLNGVKAYPYLPDLEEGQRLSQELNPPAHTTGPVAPPSPVGAGTPDNAGTPSPRQQGGAPDGASAVEVPPANAASLADAENEALPQVADLLQPMTAGYRPGSELGRIIHELKNPPGRPSAEGGGLEEVPNPFDLARRPWLPILKEALGKIPELAGELAEDKLRLWLWQKYQIQPDQDLNAQQLTMLLERAAPRDTPSPAEAAPKQAADKTRVRAANLDHWAVATCDGKQWHLYQCVRSSWRRMRGLSFREGLQSALVNLFAKGGGFMESQTGLKLWPELLKAGEYRKAMSLLQPELSHLGRIIREAIRAGGKAPVFRKEKAVWRSEVQIGYAILEDSDRGGGEAKWTIKMANDLSADERIDLG